MMVGRLQARRRSNPAPKTASTGIQLRNRTATRVPEPVEEEEECDVVIGCMKKIMLERYEADLQHAEENNKLWAQQRKLVEMDDAEREEAFRERLAQEQLHLNPHAAPVSSSTQKKTAQGNEGQVPSSRRASKEGRKRAGAPARPMEVHTGPAQSSVDGGNCDGGHQNDSLMKDAPPQPLKRKLEDDEGSMLGAKRERTGETSSAGGRPDGRQARGGVPDTGETSFPEPLLVDCMIEGSPSVSQVEPLIHA